MDLEEEKELYLRHQSLDLTIPKQVFVIGCGGVGSYVAIWSAMSGANIIHLSDDDVISPHNLSRMLYKYPDSVGILKKEELKKFISNIRPDCEVILYDGIYTDADMFQLTGDIVYDCTDDLNIQRKIHAYCKAQNIRYLKVGCNSYHVTLKENVDAVWGEADPNGRYEVVPMFFAPAVVSSVAAVWSVITGKKNIDLSQTLKEMFTHPKDLSNLCNGCELKDVCVGCVECNTDEHEFCKHCPVESME